MNIRVEALTGIDLRLENNEWAFASEERERIESHWQNCLANNSRLWNGDVLICTGSELNEGILKARFALTDFASFIAWRDWDWPDRNVSNCFGVPAVVTADRALLYGIMAPHTLNAGKLYPPAGSLEYRDVAEDGTIDIFRSMHLELKEETGVEFANLKRGRLLAIFEGQRLAVVQELHFPGTFAELETLFQRHTQVESAPELSAIEAIRHIDQIDSRMPPYAQEIVRILIGSCHET